MNGKINQLPKFVKRGNWGPKKGQSWAEVVLDQLDDRLQEKWWEMSTCSPSLIRHCKAVWDTGIVWKALAVSVFFFSFSYILVPYIPSLRVYWGVLFLSEGVQELRWPWGSTEALIWVLEVVTVLLQQQCWHQYTSNLQVLFGRCLYRKLLETPLPFSSLNAVCTQICKYIAVNKVKKQTRIPSQ